MRRSIGKRIRMDDPLPPEYDSIVGGATPAYNPDMTEPYSPYVSYGGATPYASETPVNFIPPAVSHPMNPILYQNIETPGSVYSEPAYVSTPLVQVPHPMPIQQEEQVVPYTEPQIQDHTFQQPMEPEDTGVRVTRSRLRGNQGQAPPPSYNVGDSEEGEVELKPVKRGRGRPPRSAQAQMAAAMRKKEEAAPSVIENDASLYSLIRAGRVSLQVVVDDWIETYKANKREAKQSLTQLLVNASGCRGVVTAAMVEGHMDNTLFIRRMTEEFDEENGEYPLIMSGQQWKKFRQNFCEFVAHLVKQCQYSIIYDQKLMDFLISLLVGLSDSQVRAFRHTATLATMKLMTALVDVALVVSINLDNTQRQYEAERQKARDKRASDRLESLMTKRQELEENMDEIKNMLTYLFKSVFVHRYRDTLPEIRALCMGEIGIWMKKFHQHFLDDSFLKYIGWTLHDKVGEVRLKCLQALQPLYASEELKGKLELFTSKFKDRIVSMTLDKEFDVAVQAVKLVISILKHHKDILTDKDCEHVYELVYSSHRAVAQAAGEFLNNKLFVMDDMRQGLRTKRGKKRLPNTPFIQDLVQFFIESELHEHGAYLVDSLIESNEMMKDWECMTDLLLEEPGPNEDALDDRQETTLIELMTCCVRQAATGDPPVGRGSIRKASSVKEVKQVADDKQKLTEHFIKTLPLLLDKYRAEGEKLVNLLAFPQYFDLSIYTSTRQETHLDLLLRKMQMIAEKQQNVEVLETCAKTLEVLCNEENAMLYSRCDVQRSKLIDGIVNKYKEAMDEWKSAVESNETPDDDETFNLTTSLKKISIFYACHNLGNWTIWLQVFNNMSDAYYNSEQNKEKILPEEAIRSSIWTCFYGIMWDLHHLEDLYENGGSNIHSLVLEVKSRLGKLMELLKSMVVTDSPYKEDAYLAICDLLVVFSSNLRHEASSDLSELVYEADKDLQVILNRFVQRNVFVYIAETTIDDHVKIEVLHKRRNFLASFCKLIVYSVVPISCAAEIFKHYVKSYQEYGDIIKASVGKARELNKVNCARTMVESLISLFKEIKAEDGVAYIHKNPQFSSLKELAKRFSLSFGLDALKNREAITILHREGVLFTVSEPSDDPSMPPSNLPFLEILMEFTNKLLKQDKRMILNYLERRLALGVTGSNRGEDWQPLVLYRNSLLHGESDMPMPPARRAYTRKKKEVDEEVEEDQDSDQDFGELDALIVKSGQVSKKSDGTSDDVSINLPPQTQEDHNSNRPQRQCVNRSLSYKLVEQDSEDE